MPPTPIAVDPALKDIFDWCNVPAPEHTDDTPCVQFFFNRANYSGTYCGLLFLRQQPPPVSKYHGPHIHGTGHLIPTGPVCTAMMNSQPLPPEWVRVWMPVNAGFAMGIQLLAGEAPTTAVEDLEADMEASSLGFIGLPGVGDIYYRKTTAGMS